MSQLSFDGFPAEKKTEKKESISSVPASESWYKGRVLSHSSISLYSTCPQKWKFRYIDKIPEKPKSFFSFGKSVHSSLEFLFSSVLKEIPSMEVILDHFRENWIREGYETPAQEKWFYQEGERILKGFYIKHQADIKKILQVEFRFTMDVQGVPVTGFIDRIDNTPSGGLAIIDYKTGKAFDKARVKSDPQLTLYQMAVREHFKKPIETVTLYHLNTLTPLTVPAHSSTLEKKYEAQVVEVARGINENKFDPIVDEKAQCQWCDYKQVCPAFSGKKSFSFQQPVLSDSISEVVDRYGKLTSKLNDLSQEKEKIEAQIRSYMKLQGQSILKGKYFLVEENISEPDTLSLINVRLLEPETSRENTN